MKPQNEPEAKPTLCVCQVYSKPQVKDGELGYTILRANGSEIAWVPEKEFESMHLPLVNDSMSVSLQDLYLIIESICFKKIDPHTVQGEMTLRTGFKIYRTASCLDRSIGDRTPGVARCKDRLLDALWSHMGFVSRWANNGLSERIGDAPNIIDITYLDAMNVL